MEATEKPLAVVPVASTDVGENYESDLGKGIGDLDQNSDIGPTVGCLSLGLDPVLEASIHSRRGVG